MKRALAFGLSALAVALAACQVIVGIEHVAKDPETVDSGASSSSGKPSNDPCKHMTPPALPSKDDDGDPVGGDNGIFLATVKLSFINPSEDGISGFDIDDSCTCFKGSDKDGGPPCTPPASGSVVCDGDGGVDNNGLVLFNLFNLAEQASGGGGSIDDAFNAGANSGVRNILIYLKGWNGQKNDSFVNVVIFVANGFEPGTNGQVDAGTSVWTYPNTIGVINGVPTGQQAEGYVADGKLVVNVNSTVSIYLGNVGLTFYDAIIIGNLGKTPQDLVRFDGVIGGRIKATDLLTAAGQFKVQGEPVCKNGIFDQIKKPVCQAPDITQSHKTDFRPNTVCDSISASIAVTAVTATIGTTQINDTDDGTVNDCKPGSPGLDPDVYKCP